VLDQLHRLVHRGEHPEAQQVELDEPQRLDVALVELDDDAAGHRRPFERGDVDERRGGDEHPAAVDAEVARETVDPGAELEPTLPVAHADGGATDRLGSRLGLDPGDRRLRVRWRIPVDRPPDLVGAAARRLELATLRVDGPAVDQRRAVARATALAQPGHAGRRVARSALIVRGAAAPHPGHGRQRVRARFLSSTNPRVGRKDRTPLVARIHA
jgi:hypothetical protein